MSPLSPDEDAVGLGSGPTLVVPPNGDGQVLAGADLDGSPPGDDAGPVAAEPDVADLEPELEPAEPELELDPAEPEPELEPAEPEPELEPAEPEPELEPAEPEPELEPAEPEPELEPAEPEPELEPAEPELELEPEAEFEPGEPDLDADKAPDTELSGSVEPDPLITPPEMSQMLFVDVVLLLPATHPVVVLQEADPPYRELRIPVGGAEGIAIGYAARGLATPRPLTHELVANILEEFGMTLDVVRITTVRGTAFTAEMVISGRLGARVIDCRPSDAIALALRHRLPVPIMAAPGVLVRAGSDPTGSN